MRGPLADVRDSDEEGCLEPIKGLAAGLQCFESGTGPGPGRPVAGPGSRCYGYRDGAPVFSFQDPGREPQAGAKVVTGNCDWARPAAAVPSRCPAPPHRDGNSGDCEQQHHPGKPGLEQQPES